jgi:hypothetical protein
MTRSGSRRSETDCGSAVVGRFPGTLEDCCVPSVRKITRCPLPFSSSMFPSRGWDCWQNQLAFAESSVCDRMAFAFQILQDCQNALQRKRHESLPGSDDGAFSPVRFGGRKPRNCGDFQRFSTESRRVSHAAEVIDRGAMNRTGNSRDLSGNGLSLFDK